MTLMTFTCPHDLTTPKIQRRALVVTISKPKKLVVDPMRDYSISLLCVLYKILSRLIHTCVTSIIDPQLPREQAGFQLEGELWTLSFCSCKILRTLLKLRRSFILTISDCKQSKLQCLKMSIWSWPPSLISVYTIFHPRSPESMLIPMIWL